MISKIERMNRIRRNLVLGLFWGTAVPFAALFVPALSNAIGSEKSYDRSFRFLGFVLIGWFGALIALAAAYLLYKRRLEKEPGLRAAVNDERIGISWLKAYRFAFFAVVVLAIARSVASVFLIRAGVVLPSLSWFVLIAAPLSLAGSFLYYSREVRDE